MRIQPVETIIRAANPELDAGGVCFSSPIPRLEGGALLVTVLRYRCTSRPGIPRAAWPPYMRHEIDPYAGVELRRSVVTSRDLGGPDWPADKPLPAPPQRQRWDSAQIGQLDALSPSVWLDFAAGGTSLDEAGRDRVRAYLDLLPKVEAAEMAPYRKLLAKDFDAWAARVLAGAGRPR